MRIRKSKRRLWNTRYFGRKKVTAVVTSSPAVSNAELATNNADRTPDDDIRNSSFSHCLRSFDSVSEFGTTSPTSDDRLLTVEVAFEPIRGLVNISNTCYVNAVLQILHSVHDVRHSISMHTSRHSDTCCIACAVGFGFKGDASHLRNQLSTLITGYCSGHMQDAHELLVFILDAINTTAMVSTYSEQLRRHCREYSGYVCGQMQ